MPPFHSRTPFPEVSHSSQPSASANPGGTWLGSAPSPASSDACSRSGKYARCAPWGRMPRRCCRLWTLVVDGRTSSSRRPRRKAGRVLRMSLARVVMLVVAPWALLGAVGSKVREGEFLSRPSLLACLSELGTGCFPPPVEDERSPLDVRLCKAVNVRRELASTSPSLRLEI